MDAVADIKQRLSVEDVIGEYIELKRAGRNFKGFSPFNSERTASFMVSPDKQIWHDFSSGKGGDIFGFIMEVEGLDFKGALELLARKAGVDLSLYKGRGSDVGRKKDVAMAVLSYAVKFYQQNLMQNQKALDYVVKQRGLKRQTIQDFGLGYAPNSQDGLIKALLKKDFKIDDVKLAGLASQRYSKSSDMFRGRIMIPLYDGQGHAIGFTGRILEADSKSPKYINTPQTLLYDKSRHIFGLHLAKETIRASGFVVIVEGNMDVISSHQAGIKNVVATAGTAITSSQLKILQRFTEDIRLCFDQDQAGINAAERAIEVAQSVGVQLSIISITDGKDPDELIQKSPEAWGRAVKEPIYAIDWLIERYSEIHDIKSASGKKLFSDVIANVIAKLKDSVEQDHYTKKLAKLIDANEDAIIRKIEKISKGESRRLRAIKVEPTSGNASDNYQDQLLCLITYFPSTRRMIEINDSDIFVFSTPERQRIFEYINEQPHVTINDSVPEDLQDIEDYVKILLLKAEELYAGFDANERSRELQNLMQKLKTNYYATKRMQISHAIKEAEAVGNEKLVAELLEQFNAIVKKGK